MFSLGKQSKLGTKSPYDYGAILRPPDHYPWFIKKIPFGRVIYSKITSKLHWLKCWAKKTTRINSKLPIGYEYQFSSLLLYAAFEELVSSLEKGYIIDSRWSSALINRNRYRQDRFSDLGLNWFHSEVHLGDKSPDLEILKLYIWWKFIRPARVFEGLERLEEIRNSIDYDAWINIVLSPYGKPITMSSVLGTDIEKEYGDLVSARANLENKWNDEDTEMLEKLVKYRSEV